MRNMVCTSAVLIPVALLSLVGLILPLAHADEGSQIPKLLLMSFDGFGWNYLNKLPHKERKNFDAFIEQGVHVRWIENVFPTVTRPNHMSMVSGLYPESHGIVDNCFYDHSLQGVIPDEPLQANDSRWVDKGAEPIWLTNTRAGNGRKSGTVLWPMADAKIKGALPDEIIPGSWKVNETQMTPKKRIDQALEWFTRADNPLNFVAVYMNNPDDISHHYGPDSQEILDCIRSRDEIVGYLLQKMTDLKLNEILNVIITADHGHLTIYPDQKINLDKYLDPSWYTAYPSLEHSAVANIWPKNKDDESSYYQEIVNALSKQTIPNLHIQTSADAEELKELHYSNNPRIASIVLFAEPGWVLGSSNTTVEYKGMHGWDPRYTPAMYPFFIAKGPAFHKGLRDAQPFHIVDIYELMCYILEVVPAPNNGSLIYAEHIINLNIKHDDGFILQHANYTVVGIVILLLILIMVAVVVIVRYIRKTRNVTASYRRSFARAGSKDDMIVDEGTVILSDEEL